MLFICRLHRCVILCLMNMSKILIVDDAPSIREVVMFFWQQAGFIVYTAVGGEDALANLAVQKVDRMLTLH